MSGPHLRLVGEPPSGRGFVPLVRSLHRLVDRVETDPARYLRWLPLQHAFLTSTAKARMIRAGNQSLGKSTAALFELRCLCLGQHPFKPVKPPPIEAWVICATQGQSVPIQRKFADLLPADCLDLERCSFDPVRGFGGMVPTAVFRNGSVVKFRTTNQDAIAFAGATLDVVLFDEPPTSERLYSEARKRLMRRGGTLLLAMTPINAGPLGWLREVVEKGMLIDFHSRLTPEAMIPVGASKPLRLGDGTVCDAAWIERVEAETPSHEVPVVVHGEWEFRTQGRVFKAFRADRHIQPTLTARDGRTWRAHLGIDYGTKVGKQYAVLVAVEPGEDHDRVFVVDEYVGSGDTTIQQDAQGILEMLGRNRMTWSDLDEAWGDRLYIRGAEEKSNRDLMEALARALRDHRLIANRPIRTVKRGSGRAQGSVDAGVRYLHHLMLYDGAFAVHPRCERLLGAIHRWDHSDSDDKDPIDALRYALNSPIFAKRNAGSVVGKMKIGR